MMIRNFHRYKAFTTFTTRPFSTLLSKARPTHINTTSTHNMTLTTLAGLKKSSSFTEQLLPDSQVPTVEAALDPEVIPKTRLQRRVHSGIFTWVAPEHRDAYQFLIASPNAVRDLGLEESEIKTDLFKKIMSGEEYFKDPYPYAQAYSGHQFGQYAGQLGDGRVINIFEGRNPDTNVRYQVQLKGAGLTPYSRFADGKAVLRSSIREFLVSENLNALGIPTTRALALSRLPQTTARRERRETCAVVARMAESWVRLGTFTFAKTTDGVEMTQKLADYVIDELLGGESNLLAPKADYPDANVQQNRYVRFYREVVKRNAEMLAQCQVYGFLNGVLNTDNTSVLGLSMDYGPFAFMDTFNRNYSPNHDDGNLRYGYKYVPTAMWWNLVRFAEDMGELLGSSVIGDTSKLSKDQFGRFKANEQLEQAQVVVSNLVDDIGEEYKTFYKNKLNEGFRQRLGLTETRESDHDEIFQSLLDVMEAGSLDYNKFFRTLSELSLKADGSTTEACVEKLLESRQENAFSDRPATKHAITEWLTKYIARAFSEPETAIEQRQAVMRDHNPNFVLRNWVLDEVIQAVEADPTSPVLGEVLTMATTPFRRGWAELGVSGETERKFTGPVPANSIDSTCSCSS